MKLVSVDRALKELQNDTYYNFWSETKSEGNFTQF